MEIKVIRKTFSKESTIGELHIDGKFFCYTVEDKVRAKRGMWSKLLKVYAQTAIPYGRYPVMVTWSNRFKRPLTGIFNVPDFEGIRIHNGSTERSSAGCPIISYKRIAAGQLLNETKAMNDLCDIVAAKQKTEKVWIEIE